TYRRPLSPTRTDNARVNGHARAWHGQWCCLSPWTYLGTQELTWWTTTLSKSSSSIALSARPSPLGRMVVGAGLGCNQSRDGKRRPHKWCGGLWINPGWPLGRGRGAALAGSAISLAG